MVSSGTPVASPSRNTWAPARRTSQATGTPVTGAVGPSSGFSDDERKMLSECGFRAIRLAGTRLRTETAALALASHWAARRA